MKSFLIGCGVVAVVLIIAVVGAGWWAVQTGKKMGKQMQATNEMLAAVERKFPFTPPANGLMDDGRLANWLQINKKTSAAGEAILDMQGNQGPQKMKAIGQALNQMMTAGQEQARLLEEGAMSPSEYLWIAGQVGGLLNSGDAQSDAAVVRVVKALETQDSAMRPKNSPRAQNQAGALRTVATPLTSPQIAQLVPLVKKYEQDFLKCPKAIVSNVFILGMHRGALNARPGSVTAPAVQRPASSVPAAPAAPAPAR